MMTPKTPSRRWRPFGIAVALSLAALAAAPLAHAAPGVDEPPLAAAARPLAVPAFDEDRLPNGVRVIVAPQRGLPLVTVALHLGLGAAADPDGRAGLASMTAQLRTKGALRQGRRHSATDLARDAEALGGALDAGSTWGGTSTGMTVARSKLAAATALITDTVLHPTLDGQELERLREQTADALKVPLSDPMALAGMAARRAMWGGSVYGGTVIPASLARLRLADVRAFHQRQLRPDLATLVMAGDVTLAQAMALARQTLGAWKASPGVPPGPRLEPPAAQTPATVLVNLPRAGQSGVVVMAPSVPDSAPDRRVAQVASAVLGGGYSARLNAEVRVKRGLSYGAMAGNEMEPLAGVLSASSQTDNPNAAQVAGLLQAEIARMGQDAPGAEELAARQATLVGSYGRQIETTAGLAATLLGQVERGRPLSEVQQFAPQVLAVTAQQVKDFAARHWQLGNLRTVVVGDLAAAGDGLKALDAKALVIESARLDLEAPGLVAR